MGHKTFNSIKKELTGRKVIVLSTQKNLNYTNCFIANSINEVIELCINDNEIFIAGGGQIYSQFINIAHKIYLTRVHTFIQGDTFFPEINQSEWEIVEQQYFNADKDNEYPYSFITYIKK